MANTTNYNWETPDDTDLVKDGAAAIRTLGSSIDTTTKNLNPETTTGDIAYRSATANTNTRLAIGTTGQVLTVAAGVPSWATPTTGDIEGVTAGVGISGGGISGTVTITNSMATAIDAKGDLIGGTGADTFARLAIGANGTILTADSAETTGMKWAAPAGGATSYALLNAGGTSLSSTTTTISSLSGYNKFMILIIGGSTNDTNVPSISFTLNSDSGSNYNSFGGFINAPGSYSANNTNTINSVSGTSVHIVSQSGSAGGTFNGFIFIDGANSSGIKIFNFATGANADGNNTQQNRTGGGYYTGSSVISSISLTTSAGSFDAGTIRVYGAN
jgi:hypothetical protein